MWEMRLIRSHVAGPSDSVQGSGNDLSSWASRDAAALCSPGIFKPSTQAGARALCRWPRVDAAWTQLWGFPGFAGLCGDVVLQDTADPLQSASSLLRVDPCSVPRVRGEAGLKCASSILRTLESSARAKYAGEMGLQKTRLEQDQPLRWTNVCPGRNSTSRDAAAAPGSAAAVLLSRARSAVSDMWSL